MKIRTGFVSNSSSSSFIIGCKGKITKEKILSVIKIQKDSLLYNIAESLAKFIVNNSRKITKKQYLEDMCIDEADMPEDIIEIFNNDMDLYELSASSDNYDDIGEKIMYDTEMDYESDDFIIKSNN
jgi:hypothetical protein